MFPHILVNRNQQNILFVKSQVNTLHIIHLIVNDTYTHNQSSRDCKLKDHEHLSKKGAVTEQINLIEKKIDRCLACDVCGKTKDNNEFIPCVLKDKYF